MADSKRALRILSWWVGILTMLVIALLFKLAYLSSGRGDKELTVERLNIVEPNGQLKMVISGTQRQHPGMLNGKSLPTRERGAGLVFFNEAGDECGGLLYNGNQQQASMVYSIDQFRNDQLMQLQYNQHRVAGRLARSYGLRLWDRRDDFPLQRELAYLDSLQSLHDTAAYQTGLAQLIASQRLGAERLFLGKAASGETGLFLRDSQGRVRLKIYLNEQDQPLIQVLNEAGKPSRMQPAVIP